MKRLAISILLALVSVLSMSAQELKVIEISELPLSIKARTANVRDLNGELCALVEVAVPTVKGLSFDSQKVVKSSYEDGIYSLFVPAGTKSISYRHQDFLPGTIDFASSDVQIAGGSTYRVILKKTDSPSEYQFLVINVTPKSAAVEVDGQPQMVTDGSVQMYLEVGTFHHYKVTAGGMVPVEGDAYISSPDEKTVVNVELAANTKSIRIVAPENAEVYVNERNVGRGTYDGQMPPGTYRVEARVNGYTVAAEACTVQDVEGTQEFALNVQYGVLVISSNVPNSKVMMDGASIGETPLRLNRVLPGKHTVSVSKDGYNTVDQDVVIRSNEESRIEITLEAAAKPEPVQEIVTPAPKPAPAPVPEVKKVKSKTSSQDSFVFAGADVGYSIGNGNPTFGAMAGYVNTIGGYAKFRSDFKSADSDFEVTSDGLINGGGTIWYANESVSSRTVFTLGAMFRVAGSVYPYIGAGYGSRNLYWKDESGKWGHVTDRSFNGVALDAGVMFKFGPVVLSVGGNCTAFKYSDVEVGIGIAF